VSAPTGLPPCPGLRGEPCRDYQPFTNRSADLSAPPTGTSTSPGTQVFGPGVGTAKQKKCKKHKRGKRGKRAAASRKKCRKKK
jgi:hypothetical protein